MKKLLCLLLGASLCSMAGCDTDVSTEEITNILTPETRCGMSGGIPLSSSQVNVVKGLMNNNNATERKGKVRNIFNAFQYSGADDVIYGSSEMSMLYKYAYTIAKGSDDEMYCACGTDVCDKGVGCGENDGAYSCTALNVDSGECIPVLVETRYLSYLMITNMLPMLKELIGIREALKIIVNLNIKNDRTLEINNPDGTTRIVDTTEVLSSWYMIQHFLWYYDAEEKHENTSLFAFMRSKEYVGYLDDLRKIPDYDFPSNFTELSPEEQAKQYNKLLLNIRSLQKIITQDTYTRIGALLTLASLAECMNGTSPFCPSDSMALHIAGTNKSSNPQYPPTIYSSLRYIAANRLVLAGELTGHASDLANITGITNNNGDEKIDAEMDEIANKIDKFLINEFKIMLETYTINLDDLLGDARLQRLMGIMFKDVNSLEVITDDDCTPETGHNYDCPIALKPNDISNEDAAVILNAVKGLFMYSFSSLDSKLYAAHRKFFGDFMLAVMLPEARRNLYDMTFTQNNRCVDHTSPSGQVIGINQYCSGVFFQSNVFTFGSLATAVLADSELGNQNSTDLADGIIMDTSFNLVSGDGKPLFTLTPTQVEQLQALIGRTGITKVDVESIDIYLGDERDSNPLTVHAKVYAATGSNGAIVELEQALVPGGNWVSYRCPMGASCTVNNECGMCSNTEIAHDYGYFCEKKNTDGTCAKPVYYDNAVCRKGELVQLTE